MKTTGIQLISEERKRQIEVEGWTPEHDSKHNTGDLAHASAAYALAELYRRSTKEGFDNTPDSWPFSKEWWKPSPENRIKELQKAGALIAAEIDRLLEIENSDVCYQKCESCEKDFDIDTMTADSDSNWFCTECWTELEPVLQQEYEEMKANGEIDE